MLLTLFRPAVAVLARLPWTCYTELRIEDCLGCRRGLRFNSWLGSVVDRFRRIDFLVSYSYFLFL